MMIGGMRHRTARVPDRAPGGKFGLDASWQRSV